MSWNDVSSELKELQGWVRFVNVYEQTGEIHKWTVAGGSGEATDAHQQRTRLGMWADTAGSKLAKCRREEDPRTPRDYWFDALKRAFPDSCRRAPQYGIVEGEDGKKTILQNYDFVDVVGISIAFCLNLSEEFPESLPWYKTPPALMGFSVGALALILGFWQIAEKFVEVYPG